MIGVRHTSDTIRAAGLLGFRRLVNDLGGDPDAMLDHEGIEPASLDSPDNRISYSAMIRLLEHCAEKLDCPDFGLRLSGYQSIDILGPAAMIARFSDTVDASLKAIATYLYVHTTGANVTVVPMDDRLSALTFEVTVPGLHAERQINELSIGIGQSLLEMLIGRGYRCEHVQFTHRWPKDAAPLIRRFGRHLSFGRSVNALVLDRSELSKPVASANPEFRNIAVDYVRDHLGDQADNRVRRVILLIHQLLPTGRCTLPAIASILGTHQRTLQRDLHRAGLEFRGLLNRTRRELAEVYLVQTDATLTQVAAMLGYSDQAAFNNAFRSWFGEPPGQWRSQQSSTTP